MDMCVLAWTKRLSILWPPRLQGDKACIVRAHKEPVKCVRVCPPVDSTPKSVFVCLRVCLSLHGGFRRIRHYVDYTRSNFEKKT